MSFPSIINIELTNACNKSCWMCGRRKKEQEDADFFNKYTQHMPFELVEKLAYDLKDNKILLQFHWDGDPTMYPRLGDALKLFKGHIRCFNTNGKLIVRKAAQIIDNLESLTISTFQNDPEWEEQYNIVQEFLQIKGDHAPIVIIRQLGDIPEHITELYKKTGLTFAKRILHSPDGSFGYTKTTVVPEHGICLEALMHPAIDVNGDMSICVRFDPNKYGVLGNIKEQTIEQIWNGPKRAEWLEWHVQGKRQNHPLCAKCEFYGIPRG